MQRKLEWIAKWSRDRTGVTEVSVIVPLEIGPLRVEAALRIDTEVQRGPTVRVTISSQGLVLVAREESVGNKLEFRAEDAAARVTPQVARMIDGLLTEAHKEIHHLVDEAQDRLVALNNIRAKMAYVTLHHGEKKAHLTLDVAELVLLAGTYLTDARPFRLEQVALSLAVAFDDRGREMGRIGFDPTDPRNHRNHPQSRGYYGFYQIVQQSRPGEEGQP